MSEYWKSNAKKFCQICKIWFADNKVSVENHERGLKHKAMIQQRLREGAKKAKDKERENSELQHTLIMMEQAARASMGKSSNKTAPIPSHMSRPTIMEVPLEYPQPQQQASKFQSPQTSATQLQWQGPKMERDYSNIPATSLDLSQFEPSPYNFEKEQKLKRKINSEFPESRDASNAEEIRPIKISKDIPEEEIKPSGLKRPNKPKKHNTASNIASDGGPKIGAWVPVEKKLEVPKKVEERSEAEIVEEIGQDPEEFMFKEKVLPIEPKKGKAKLITFKKRNLGSRNLRVRNEEE